MAKALIVPPAFLAMMIWAFATTGGGEIFHQKGTSAVLLSRGRGLVPSIAPWEISRRLLSSFQTSPVIQVPKGSKFLSIPRLVISHYLTPCTQSIYSTLHYPCYIHTCGIHWNCLHICWLRAIRWLLLMHSSNFQHKTVSYIGRRDPLRLIDNWDNRAAAFFASLAFALATICTNISANSLSAANDFTALMPRVRSEFATRTESWLIAHS